MVSASWIGAAIVIGSSERRSAGLARRQCRANPTTTVTSSTTASTTSATGPNSQASCSFGAITNGFRGAKPTWLGTRLPHEDPRQAGHRQVRRTTR